MPHATPAAVSSVAGLDRNEPPPLPVRYRVARRADFPRPPMTLRNTLSRRRPGCMSYPFAVRGSRSERRPHPRQRGRALGFGREILAVVDEPVGFEPVLLVVQLAVAPVQREQLRVRAALDDLPRFEHQDLVSAADGG